MIKLLIADDEDFVRNGLIKNIRWDKLGIDIIEEADDGLSAWKKVNTLYPDIILTDIRMPRMDGIELSLKVKEILPDCKIIFMSAYSEKEYFKSAINMKAISYVEKPIVLQEITNALDMSVSMCREEEKRRKDDHAKEKQLQESMQIFQNNIVLELIKPALDGELIDKWVRTTGIDMSVEGNYAVAILKLDRNNQAISGENTASQDYAITKIEAVISSNGLNYLSSSKENNSIIMVFYEKHTDNHTLTPDRVEKACKDILEYFKGKLEIFIGIGKLVKGIENIRESCRIAELTCQQLFFSGYDSLVRQSITTDAFYFEESLIKVFAGYLEEKKISQSIQFIRDLSHQVRLHPTTPVKYIRNIYFLLLLQLIKSGDKRGITVVLDNSESFIWETISGYYTLKHIEDYLIENINIYCKRIEESEPANSTVNDIIKIISEQHDNSNLSIKTISERLFLSHTYLCVVFKKETGKTINQYLTEYRVEKAKELLKNQNIKLFDVTVRVGYTDHNYFTKIFKKITAMTPTEYKEKYIK